MSDTSGMRITSANIKDLADMPMAFVKADAHKVGLVSDIALFQEIDHQASDDDQSVVMQGLGPAWSWVPHTTEHEIPIAYRSAHWEVMESGIEFLSHGRAKVSPTRYASWARLRRKHGTNSRLKKLRHVVVINTHLVSGAFTHPGQIGDADGWRKAAWHEEWSKIQVLVKRFAAEGLIVFVGGDWNATSVPKFVTSQRWLAHHWYDHIGVVEPEGGDTVEFIEQTFSVGQHSDHASITVHCWLKPAA